MSAPNATLTRRALLRGLLAAGGLVLAAPVAGARVSRLLPGAEDELFAPDLWLSLAPDGAVRIVTHRSEMGTGIRTTLPMVVADELGADWGRVSVEQALGDERYGSQNTDGSRSIRRFLQPMREVGASARLMLERAAAARWGVPASECEARAHAVHHAPSERVLGFGELVADAATQPVPQLEELRYRRPEELRYVGKGVPATDLEAIVRGTAPFGLDVDLPGSLIAVVARPPVLGAAVVSYDDSAAFDVEGVIEVVRLPDGQTPPNFFPVGGVAVVAMNTWAALEGRRALKIEWGDSPHADFDTRASAAARRAALEQPGQVIRKKGDAEAALERADSRLDALYETPPLAHVSMEPPCALAVARRDGCEVWAPTQNPQAAQNIVAAVLRLPPESVAVHVTLLGGGFGRKSKPDYIAEAALISRELGGRPIQLVWTREDDVRHDYYHAPASVAMSAGFDAQGELLAVRGRTSFPSISTTFAPGIDRGSAGEASMGFTDMPYDFPALQLETCPAEAHLRIGWLRSVCNIFHGFAVSSFVDELAVRAGADPAEHLLAQLGADRELDLAAEDVASDNYGDSLETHPFDVGRMKSLVRRVRKASGWGGRLPQGEGRGIAVHRSFCADVAVVVHVAVSRAGELSVPRVDIAMDCGQVIHPERVRAQCEGAVIFGLGLALHGEISASAGAVEQSNFHDHQLLRMNETPGQLHVQLVESSAPPGGAGEPGVPPVAPALANAIAAATGKRVRSLPISKHDLSWA